MSLPAVGARSLDAGPAGAGAGAEEAALDEPPAPGPAEVRPGERGGAEPDLDEVARLTFDFGVGVWIALDCADRVEAVEVEMEVEAAGVARLLAR